MQNVLVTTDFSAASKHALDYACLLIKDREVLLDLLHIFEVPATFTSDGVALAGIGNDIARVEEMMDEELQRIRTAHPNIKVEGRVITGSFLETVRQETRLTRPALMILGTAGFNDLYLGGEDPLNALRMVPVPVLFIPLNAPLKPIHNIAYACNYAYVGERTPIDQIKRFAEFTKATIQIIHTDKQAHGVDAKQAAGERWLQEQLEPLSPTYHWIEDNEVLHGIASFIKTNEIDCMMVVPRKYGIWESLFHSSRTKALARLNKVPVIAFHEK